MINQQLLDFIKKEKSAGKTNEQIKTELLGGDWKVDDIEEAFTTITKGGTINTQDNIPNIYTNLILFIQIIVIFFIIISLNDIIQRCSGVGEFCGLGFIYTGVPLIITLIIITIIGYFFSNKKKKICRLSNQRIPISVRLLNIFSKVIFSVFILLILAPVILIFLRQ